MTKLLTGVLMTAAVSAVAGSFPYDAEMRACHESNSVTVASLTVPVSVPESSGGKMVQTESLATILVDDTTIHAMDIEDWQTSTNVIGSVQAAFSLVYDDDTLKWMGYTGGEWVQLSGVTAVDGSQWDVKIDIDYSLSANDSGAPKIRYSLRAYDSEGDYTVLKPSGATDDWLSIGDGSMKVAGVDIYGFLTTGPVKADAGTRAAEGTVEKVEDIGMAYDSIKLKVTASDTWGVSNVVVALKSEKGVVLTAQTNEILAAGNDFTFSNVKSGDTYTYDIQLVGGYGGAEIKTAAVASSPIAMYSSDDWFAFTGTAFTNATSTGLTIADGKFYATDDEVEGTITPEDPDANVGTVVTSTFEVNYTCTDMPDFGADVPQFAITLGESDSVRVWKYYDASGWHSSTAALPTTNGVYEGRATFDYATMKVKYELRSLDDDDFTVLAEEVSLPSGKTSLDAVGVRGAGNVCSLRAQLKKAAPPPVTPDEEKKEIVLTSNANVDLSNMNGDYTVSVPSGKKCHLMWTDSDGKFAKKVGNTLQIISGTPANEMTSYHSHVLGLDAEDETSRPAAVIKPGESQSGGIKVYVPNVEVSSDCGYTVLLQRQKSTDGGATWSDDGDAVSVDSTVTIPLTGDSAGTLYRVNTILK